MSSPRSLRCRASRAAVALIFALLALPALAQTPNDKATEAPAPAPPPKAKGVPIAEIGVQAEREKRLLAEAESSLEPVEAVSAVGEKLPELAKRVEAQVVATKERLASEPAIITIDELKREWDALVAELKGLQDTLLTRADDLGSKVDSLAKQLERWKVTRLQAEEGEANEAVVAQIDEVLALGAKVDAAAKRRQGAVVELQSGVASLSEKAKAQLERLAEARQSLVGLIFERDRLPIWSPTTVESLGSSEIVERVSNNQAKEWAATVEWAKRRSEALTLHGLLFLALSIGMIAIRVRLARRAERDAGLAKVMAVFRHPVALALLLTILLSTWTLPQMPRFPNQLLGAALLIPAVLILRSLLDARLFPILNALVLFWFIDRMREFLGPLPHLPRIIFLAEMAALVALMLWWMRPARLRDIPMEAVNIGVFRAAHVGTRVILVAAAVAFVADASGYGALARLIGNAGLFAAYAAVILYGAVRVMDGIVAFLLRVRPLRLLGMVQRHRWMLRRRTVRFIGFGASVWWASLVLARLEVLEQIWAGTVAFFTAELAMGQFTISLTHILAAVLVVYFTLKLSRFVRFALEEDVYPRANLRKGMPYAISSMTHYVLLTIGGAVAVGALGLDLSSLALVVGALGVGIGFGLQNVVNNFVSGLILLTERPVDVGDTVSLGEVFGEVQRIGIRSSTVRTWQGAEVIVPNADLVSEQVTNWTHSDRRRRLEIEVGVPYGSDPSRVLELLLEAAKSNPDVMTDPAPYVLFVSFGESYLQFEVRAWTSDFDRFLQVKTSLLVTITRALKEAGIQIPFPQRDLHIRSVAGPKHSLPDDPHEPA